MIAYSPTSPLETFAEALSVPPLMHVSPSQDVKILCFGQFSLPMAKLALRYPNTREVHLVGYDAPTVPSDSRVTAHASLDQVPRTLVADLIAVVVPGDPTALLEDIGRYLDPAGVLVVALDQFGRGRTVKDSLRKRYRHVLPYREFTPPDISLFLMASNRKLGTSLRPFPPGLRRLNPRYARALFDLAADEYAFLYGPVKV